MKSKYKWPLVSTFALILSLSLFTGVAEQAKTDETLSDRSQTPIPQSGSIQKESKSSHAITVDGVRITVDGSILPPSTNYTFSAPGDLIQMATAVTWHPFREVTITAVPFGTKTGAETMPVSQSGGAGVYAASLMDYRARQGTLLQREAIVNIFGQQVVGSASVVSLNIDGPIATPVVIVEWVVEAGERLWIIRASHEKPVAGHAIESSSDALALIADLSISSDSLYKPSTIRQTSDALPNFAREIVPEVAASLAPADLAAPYWWNGYDCDSNHYYAGSGGRSAFRLGAVYLGMPACGPRPIAGGPDVAVTWGGGVTQLEWECAELSKRYLYLAHAVTPYQANGSQVVWNYSGNVLEKISNGASGRAPQPGDVLSYGATSTAGHTSVVMTSSVDGNGNGSITVIEENNSAGGSSTLSVSNWIVNGNAGSVSGWLHNGCTNVTSTLRNRDGGPPIHPPGSVIKIASSPTVYLIDSDNRKRAITSSSVLAQLYNQATDARTSTNFSNWVITVGQDELDLYEQGGNISAAQPGNGRPFPDGKLISYNGEVSVVTASGNRRPFVTESTFTGLGFQFCQVVNVSLSEYNSYPLGPPVDAMPLLTSSVNLLPAGPYTAGQNISGSFTIKNVGYQSFPFSSLGIGGRLNGSTVYDLGFVSTTLAAGSSYPFGSQAVQLTSTGTYDFFAAYQETNGHWAISVPAAPGIIRSRQITTTAQNYTIAVSASPSTGGTVSGGGTFAAGSSRTVTATANSGYTFSNWTENGSVASSSASYSFTLNSNRSLVANFTTNAVNYTIQVSASPSAGGSVGGGGTFAAGSSRTVTATANTNYSFTNWTENGNAVSSSSSYTFTLNSNRTLIANFASLGTTSTWTDTDIGVGADNRIRALWNNIDGSIALWVVAPDGTFQPSVYGPYAGWTAKSIAAGSDNLMRVLWTHSNGSVSLWVVAANGTFQSNVYGPYSGWTATDIAVGSDNLRRVLWNNTDGSIALWVVAPDGSLQVSTYGPYSGWTARRLAAGADNKPRVLWTNTDGSVALWVVQPDGTFQSKTYGPYAGWKGVDIAVGSDNKTRVLWTNTDGTIALWIVSPVDSSFQVNVFGPYAGWTGKSIAVGSDNKTRVLWTNTNGSAAQWVVAADGTFQVNVYGPY